MSLRYLVIASAFLIALCVADVSELKPEVIELPFNDLLPPLQDESGTTSTTSTSSPTLRTTRSTTTTTTTLATKPTKKSYYTKPVQPAKADKVKPSADIQLLSLDLLPPFEDEAKPAEEQTQQVVSTEPSALVKITPPPTPKPAITVPAPAAPKPAVRVTQAAPRPAIRVAPPAYSVHPAPPVALPHVLGSGSHSRFSNYFLTSTPRPRRGPLPTITPFPRHVRL